MASRGLATEIIIALGQFFLIPSETESVIFRFVARSSSLVGMVPSGRVVRVLDTIAAWRGYPQRLRVDNGPELISQRMASWAEKSDVLLDFIEPGKPAQNAYIERFNRTYREDVLDFYLFSNLAEAREITDQWLEEYNAIRPHDSLGGKTPYQIVSVNVQESESVH